MSMAKRISLSDVNKKHIKVIAYLAVSAASAYVLSVLSNKPEAIYLAPLINYLIYAIRVELKKEGYIKVLKN